MLLAQPIVARAQQETSASPGDAGSTLVQNVVEPKLKHFVEAVYPTDTEQQGLGGTVVLQLGIDEQGRVFELQVVESLSTPFDEAAALAAAGLLFSPALRDGQPVASRILFRYQFEPRVAATTNASYEGRLLNAATGQPLPNLTIELKRDGQVLARVQSDTEGRFVIPKLAAGRFDINVNAAGFRPLNTEDTVSAGELREVVLSLLPLPAEPPNEDVTTAVEVTATGVRSSAPTVVRSIKQEELRRVPGTFGDALKSLQSLPGVARTPSLSGLLVVRGTPAESTQVFFQGILTPQIYHFGGLSSVLPTEMLESIEFQPGNFGAAYGRGIGGVVDAKIRRSTDDGRFHGMAQVDLVDARAIAEGPLPAGDGWRLLAGVRRSHLDAWLGGLLEGTDTSFTQLPVYYDYQLFADREDSAGNYVRVGIFGADDQMHLISESSIFLSEFRRTNAFWNAFGEVQTRLGPHTEWQHTTSFGRLIERIVIGPLHADTEAYPITTRGTLRHSVSKELTISAGPDIAYAPFRTAFVVSEEDPSGDAFAPSPLGRPPRIAESQSAFFQPAVFAEAQVFPQERWQVTGGLRVDYSDANDEWNLSPRLNARYALKQQFPKTSLKAAAGLYYEPPEVRFTLPEYGSASLLNARSTQFALGVDQDLSQQLEFSAEGFVSLLSNLLSRGPNADGIAVYNSLGEGEVIGAEALLRYKPDERFFGWLSYTLSQAMRRTAPDAPRRLFLGDQTHIASILGSLRLGAGFEVGGRFRLVSGDLYQPCGQALLSSSDGAFVCLPAGEPLTRRPLFHQLDLRVEKQWRFAQDLRLSAYLDIINVYNRQQADLPFVPSVGLRGEL